MTHTGQCLCGAVIYTTVAELRSVVNCHCRQCRQFHGHYAAYTAVARNAIRISDQEGQLAWYDSSPGKVRRGFCRRCGSSLFWDRLDSELLRVAAGSLTEPTGLETQGHIYVDSAGDYYHLTDDLPKKRQGLNSADVGE